MIAFSLLFSPVPSALKSENERKVGVGKIKDHLVKTPCHRQWRLSLDQIAQSSTNLTLNTDNDVAWQLLGQPVPVLELLELYCSRELPSACWPWFFVCSPGYSWLTQLQAYIVSSCPIFHSPVFPSPSLQGYSPAIHRPYYFVNSRRTPWKKSRHFTNWEKSRRPKERWLSQMG